MNDSGPTFDYFISYAKRDADDLSGRLARRLESRGLRVWRAPESLQPGVRYQEGIMGAIAGCREMLVLISEATAESKHQFREVDLADQAGVSLIPVRIAAATIPRSMTYILAGLHYISVAPGSTEETVDAILGKLRLRDVRGGMPPSAWSVAIDGTRHAKLVAGRSLCIGRESRLVSPTDTARGEEVFVPVGTLAPGAGMRAERISRRAIEFLQRETDTGPGESFLDVVVRQSTDDFDLRRSSKPGTLPTFDGVPMRQGERRSLAPGTSMSIAVGFDDPADPVHETGRLEFTATCERSGDDALPCVVLRRVAQRGGARERVVWLPTGVRRTGWTISVSGSTSIRFETSRTAEELAVTVCSTQSAGTVSAQQASIRLDPSRPAREPLTEVIDGHRITIRNLPFPLDAAGF